MKTKMASTNKRQIEDRVFDICDHCGAIIWGGTFEEINRSPAEIRSTRTRKAIEHRCRYKKSGY